MINPEINELFLYRKNDSCGHAIDIFTSGLLYAPKPHRFNDPYDCDLNPSSGINELDFLRAAQALHGSPLPVPIQADMDRRIDETGVFFPGEGARIQKVIDDYIAENKNSGVICLSEKCDDILMWSHYTNRHQGICIGFSRTDADPCGDDERCEPVTYSSQYPKIDFGNLLFDQSGKVTNLMMRYKFNQWSYEKEWRMITDRGNVKCPHPGKITKVIFGKNTPADYQAEVRKAAVQYRPSFYKISLLNGSFSLNVDPVG